MASENISFDTIPSGIRRPGSYSEFNFATAQKSLPVNAQTMAIIAQKTSAGTLAIETPKKVFSADEVQSLAGVGSIAHLCAKAALKANPRLDLTIVLMDDASGTPAEGTITIATDATATGTLNVWVGNVNVSVVVEDGDTPTEQAVALTAALNLKVDQMPMTFVSAIGVVTATARNEGLLGNNIPISYNQGNITGSTYTVVQPTGGATDPDITNALTAIFPEHYSKIVCTLGDATNLALLKQHLIDTSAPQAANRQIGVFGYTGVQATIETLCGTTLNYERLTCGYVKYTKTSERGHSLDFEIAGAYGSVAASEDDPARPLNQLPLAGIATADVSNNYSFTQEESLLDNGVTPLKTFPGSVVGISRAITTYTTNASGFTDPSRLDLTTMTIADFTALSIETNQQSKYGRAKGRTGIEDSINTQNIQVCKALEDLQILRNVDNFLDGFLVEEDLQNTGQFNSQIPTPVVPGLHVLANKLDIYL